jgi:hypothetical protein
MISRRERAHDGCPSSRYFVRLREASDAEQAVEAAHVAGAIAPPVLHPCSAGTVVGAVEVRR